MTDKKTPAYVLITQCLQNDLFLNLSCGLVLPHHDAERVLVGTNRNVSGSAKKKADLSKTGDGQRRVLSGGEHGPIGSFLKTLMEDKDRAFDLHIIHLRDWHEPSPRYDRERSAYGCHCEAGSWGADFITGMEKLFDPGRKDSSSPPTDMPERHVVGEHDGTAKEEGKGRITIHYHKSNSLFDFERVPRESAGPNGEKAYDESPLDALLRDITFDKQAYIGVVGVYTDIKIQLLLTALRSRYAVDGIAVADSMTASASLERHLAGLDFAKKVLDVDVIHSLNDMLLYLGATTRTAAEDVIDPLRFSDYASFFQDKQTVLMHGAEKLGQYLDLADARSQRVYELARRACVVMMWAGGLFLGLALIIGIKETFWGDGNWQLTTVFGGLGVGTFVSIFMTRPMQHLIDNLTSLIRTRVILESHCFKSALARFHLTLPNVLTEVTEGETTARQQVEVLRGSLEQIESIQGQTGAAFGELGFDQKPIEEGSPSQANVEGNAETADDAAGKPEKDPVLPAAPAQKAKPAGKSGAAPKTKKAKS